MSFGDYAVSMYPAYGTHIGGGQYGFSESEYNTLMGFYNAGAGATAYGVF